jgi:hypothetical protein
VFLLASPNKSDVFLLLVDDSEPRDVGCLLPVFAREARWAKLVDGGLSPASLDKDDVVVVVVVAADGAFCRLARLCKADMLR